MFRIEKPTENDLAFFHKNGYVAFPSVLTEEARQGLMDEILRTPLVAEFLGMTDEERSQLTREGMKKPHRLSSQQWDDKGPFADQLLDAPLVAALLRSVIGEDYHFCHSELRISMPGSIGLPFHHDNRPVNLAERHKWYIQMLYYPNGFERGDTSLWVIPGSHKIVDWGEYAPYGPTGQVTAQLLTTLYAEQVGGALREEELGLPPGSMVFMNARMFHAISPKPMDSPQKMRMVTNYLFKEPGSPHPYTQVIPPAWMADAGPERQRMFHREAAAEVFACSEKGY